jgi:hypothetical protein
MRTRIAAVTATAAALLALTACSTSSPHATAARADKQAVADYNDGFIDGAADAIGDDNGNGRIEPGETGWACRHTRLSDLKKCLAATTAAGGTPSPTTARARRVAYGTGNIPAMGRRDQP